MRRTTTFALLAAALACSPQEPTEAPQPAEPGADAPVEVVNGIAAVPVTLGNQRVTLGMTSIGSHETIIYVPDPEQPNDLDAAPDMVRIRTERMAEVTEVVDGAATAVDVDFGKVSIDVRGAYQDEAYASALAGRSYRVAPTQKPIQITHRDGSPLTDAEIDEIEDVETRILHASQFTWLRGRQLQPGDAIALNPEIDDLFQSLMETGQAVRGQLTYQGTTNRRGLEVAQFEIGLLSMQLSDIGTGQMGLSGHLWVDVETGWVDEVEVMGTMAGTPEEGGTVRIRYENRADFTHTFPDAPPPEPAEAVGEEP